MSERGLHENFETKTGENSRWSKPGARVTCNRGTKVGPCRAPRPRQFGARMGKRISRLIGIPKILGVGEPVVHTFLRPSPPHEP